MRYERFKNFWGKNMFFGGNKDYFYMFIMENEYTYKEQTQPIYSLISHI